MYKLAITAAATLMFTGAAMAEGISSRFVHGDASPPMTRADNSPVLDYLATASIRAQRATEKGRVPARTSSRYVYGDAGRRLE